MIGVGYSQSLEFVVRFARFAILDEWFIDQLGREHDMAGSQFYVDVEFSYNIIPRNLAEKALQEALNSTNLPNCPKE
jgi:hypothetical protein